MPTEACSISINCTTIAHAEWQRAVQLPPVAAPMVFRVQVADYAEVAGCLGKYVQAGEQRRAAGYYHARHAERFLLGRATLRLVLGNLMGRPAEMVELATSQAGKLYCANAPEWHLSISYDDAWLIVAIARAEVGVDIEKIKPEFAYGDVAASCFSEPEQQYVAAAKDPAVAFFQSWTRKEAMAKALGTGIDDYFGGLPALDGMHTVPQAQTQRYASWVLASFIVDAQHLGALAYPATVTAMRPVFYHLQPLWYQTILGN
ncbi:4'-phosphopantetheinyl transferase superfamily protein [Hymenobacter sp. BT507]|uniref:4'-phosphopantetheinyl transferase superfamily protein n=1 Tax=Hymenobacter citatus TaxID=2763506 RepID=A0ABR7MMC3_9BACT|nr:4'-phosphopantetheinyl transferase superfamily protein [Hymenobacter citatus]MBC6612093.1 4'-phosphopantetheinyl transferase superfamily protein [Hymenobacter citatus]